MGEKYIRVTIGTKEAVLERHSAVRSLSRALSVSPATSRGRRFGVHLTPVRAAGSDPAVVVIAAARWADLPDEAVNTLTEVARARPVYYVEPPLAVGAARVAVITAEPSGPVERVWLSVSGIGEVTFDDVRAADYPAHLATWLHHRRAEHRDVWLCDLSAQELAAALLPGRLVLDPPLRCCAEPSEPSPGDLAPAAGL